MVATFVLKYQETVLIGRDSGIRTHDLFTPSEARYQAALYPVLIQSGNADYIMREEVNRLVKIIFFESLHEKHAIVALF